MHNKVNALFRKCLCVILISCCSIIQFKALAQWSGAGLAGSSIYALTSDNINLYAGVFARGVFRSGNAGSSWVECNNGLPAALKTFDCFISCFAVIDSTIFVGTAGTKGAGIYVSSDHGTNWFAVNTGLSNLKVNTLIAEGNTLFVGTNGGGVFQSNNKGGNWSELNAGLTHLNVSSLAVKGNKLYAGTHGGGIFINDLEQSAWTTVNTRLTNLNIFSLTVIDSQLFAGTKGSGVFSSSGNGYKWKAVNVDLPMQATVYLLGKNGNTLFAGIKGHGIYLSHNFGDHWRAINKGLPGVQITSLIHFDKYIYIGLDRQGLWRCMVPDKRNRLKRNPNKSR